MSKIIVQRRELVNVSGVKVIIIIIIINITIISHKTLSTNRNLFDEKLRTADAESNRGPSASQPNVLPLGQTGS